MASFTKSDATEQWLNRRGVSFKYRGSMKIEQLRPGWNETNAGRANVHGKSVLETHGDTVIQYATMFEDGSSAPAVIIHKGPDGMYEMLDGVLRVSAAETLGHTIFCAYEVDAEPDVLMAIRLCANSNLNGKRADDDWTVDRITTQLIEDQRFSLKDCSVWSAFPVDRFRKEMFSREGSNWMKSNGVDIDIKPANQKLFCTNFAKKIDKGMRKQAPDSCADIVKFCQRMKCNNGEAEEMVDVFANIKRKPKVPLATQINSKLDELQKDNAARLRYGKRKMLPIDVLVRAMATAVTAARNTGVLHADQDQSAKLIDNLKTMKRLLRKIVPREDWVTESDIIV